MRGAGSENAAGELLGALEAHGRRRFTGVPCSLLRGAFALLEQAPAGRYVPAVREDSAVGLAAGLQLAGEGCAVLMQNSGLGYCLNPLLSLAAMYGLELLLVVGWRGARPGDAPEHAAIGARLPAILTAAGLPGVPLRREAIAASVGECAELAQRSRGPSALLVGDAL